MSVALDAFYRARDEPVVHSEHIAHNLSRYVDAIERAVRDEQAHMAGKRASMPGASVDATHVEKIRAAVAYAERMQSTAPATSSAMIARIQRVKAVADGLLGVVAPRTVHVTPTDEYWNDYLYEGLAQPRADHKAPEHEAFADNEVVEEGDMDDEYGHKPAPEMIAGRSEAGSSAVHAASSLRQRKHGAEPPRPSDSSDTHTPRLQSERSLQDALSNELLRMASVLKANTAAFSESLERDRKLVEEAGGQLDQNLSLMTRTRGQLGVFSKKARSMGWFTLGSIASVVVCWLLMFIVIRLT